MVKETNPFDNVSAEHIPVEKVGDLGSYADEFKKYIRENNIKTQNEWKLFVKHKKSLNGFPKNIPST